MFARDSIALEAITCLYLWPWSALYKLLISCSQHLTPGQALDEYINVGVSDLDKFLYRKCGGRQVTQGQDHELFHESVSSA
jgi:hypothetical protein